MTIIIFIYMQNKKINITWTQWWLRLQTSQMSENLEMTVWQSQYLRIQKHPGVRAHLMLESILQQPNLSLNTSSSRKLVVTHSDPFHLWIIPVIIKFTLICIKILPHCSFYLLIQILYFRLIRKVICPSSESPVCEHKLHGKLESFLQTKYPSVLQPFNMWC